VVTIACRLYAAALRLLPQPMRGAYGDDMQRTFDARCRDAAARSTLGAAAFIAREIADLATASVRARLTAPRRPGDLDHRRRSVNMFWQHVRYAFRMLRRQPSFASIAIVTLAVGIGATTAVFTVVDGVLMRPLPYRDPDRLVQLFNGRNGRFSTAFSPPNYRDITRDTGVFSDATAMTPSTANLTGLGDPQQLDGANVTTTFFDVLGVAPRLGRAFRESDLGSKVVVVSDGLWRRQLGGGADVAGTTLRLDGEPFEIIGVAPAEVAIPGRPDYWRPLVLTPDNLSDAQRGAQWVGVIARLQPGVTIDRANAVIAIVAERLARDYPRVNLGRQMSATVLRERIVRGIRPTLLLLLGAVTLVLLIACANVANLLLARAGGRAREVAMRTAVGASRLRLLQQFLVESLVLGLAGGAAGLLVAWAIVRTLVALGPAIPRLADVAIDLRVLAFTVLTAIATSVVFGLIPALAATGGSFVRLIGSAGRGSIGASSNRTRKLLVVSETALAVVLLAAAGLLVRSYFAINGVNPGFSPDRVLTFTVSLPQAKYPTDTSISQMIDAYVQRLGASPRIESAAAVFGLPLDDNFSASSSFTRPGEQDSGNSPSVGMRVVTGDYFRTLKIPLRSGRTFDAHDDGAGMEVAIINEEAARRYWPGQDPIGQQLHLGARLANGVRSGMKTIVGVVGDVKYEALDASAPPEVYLPHAQHPVDNITIAVRAKGDPLAIVGDARAALAMIDREMPIAAVRTMDEVVGRSIAERRFTMLLLGAFAAVAVLLAAIGVYGVLAYLVSLRTQEIGVRLAIGASPRDVARLFLREGVTLVAIGLAVGLAGAIAAVQALRTLLFGVAPSDPLTFAAVVVALGLSGLCASYLPARRAARVDPMEALRTD
jgi:putative ABC transport system permease protein